MFPSQLQDPSAEAVLSSLKTSHPPQTLTEKIVQRHSLGLGKDQYVKAGDFVTLAPAYTMTHDNSWPTALKFMSIGASKIANPRQVVMALDHDVQNKSDSNLKKYRQIEEFATRQAVDFYPAGRGIGHQIMVEELYAYPGTLAGKYTEPILHTLNRLQVASNIVGVKPFSCSRELFSNSIVYMGEAKLTVSRV